jgi:uncharacterized protein (TIGR02996 family)
VTDAEILDMFRVWRRMVYDRKRKYVQTQMINVGQAAYDALLDYQYRRADILGSNIDGGDGLQFLRIPVVCVEEAVTKDERAFLAASKGNHGDWLSRAVYADWLEDRGRIWEAAYWRSPLTPKTA